MILKTPHIYGTLIDISQFYVVVYFEVRKPRLPFPLRLSYTVRRVHDSPENVLPHSVSARSTIGFSYRVCKSTDYIIVQYYVDRKSVV